MRFKLVKQGREVRLKAYTGDNIWDVLRFTPTGRIIRCIGLPDDIGFQTDNEGRIIIRD